MSDSNVNDGITSLDQKQKKLVKSNSKESIRDWIKNCNISISPNEILRQAEGALKVAKKQQTSTKEQLNMVNNAILLLGHERHFLVAESVVDERWRPMVLDFADCIQKEYACVGNSEIALAGLAASAYYRSLRAARKMNALLEKTETGVIGVNLLNQVSKEIDRADRQYLTAIEILRERRQPQMNVRVQTKAAFFGNQTINTQSSHDHYGNNDQQ